MRGFLNPVATRSASFRGLFADDDYRTVFAYFAAHPELAPTPLRSLPALAASLGLGAVSVKDESARFELNAFKIVGVRYAIHRLMSESDRGAGSEARLGGTSKRGVVCATAGNHGRAVARVASEHGLPCTVFVSGAGRGGFTRGSAKPRRPRRRDEGGRRHGRGGSRIVRGRRAPRSRTRSDDRRRSSSPTCRGRATRRSRDSSFRDTRKILEEAYGQWRRTPDVIVVQGGVGGLVCAAASWCAWRFGAARPFVIACEPDGAACLLASAEAGKPIALEGPMQTCMAGLRCAKPSPAAWPAIARGVDAFVSIPDSLALDTVERLAEPEGGDPPIHAGLSGACGAAALVGVARAPELAHVRRAVRMDRSTHALVIVTEGP